MSLRQKGFTLIELVIVIVILGILAATALPRFVNLQADARNAKVRGAEGSIRGAAAIAHATTLARSLAPNAAINMDGVNITMCNGYPTADAAGIQAAAQLVGADWNIAGGGAAGGDVLTIQEVGDPTANCQVTYTAPAGTVVPANCTQPGNGPAVASTTNCT